MQNEIQLKRKKERNFFEWLEIVKITQKKVNTCFTVPEHIIELDCGCKRNLEEPQFLVKIENGNLVHHKWIEGEITQCFLFKIKEEQNTQFKKEKSSFFCRSVHIY